MVSASRSGRPDTGATKNGIIVLPRPGNLWVILDRITAPICSATRIDSGFSDLADPHRCVSFRSQFFAGVRAFAVYIDCGSSLPSARVSGWSSFRRKARQIRVRPLIVPICSPRPTRSNRALERTAVGRKWVKLPTNSAEDPYFQAFSTHSIRDDERRIHDYQFSGSWQSPRSPHLRLSRQDVH